MPKLPTMGGNAVIASIFPLACPKVTLQHGDGERFMSEYSIPACPKGEVRILVIQDAFEKNTDLLGAAINGKPSWIPVPVLADGPFGIAADLVRQWSSSMINMGDGVGPGIMVIATGVDNPDSVRPTAEQLADMKSRQARWFEMLYYEGDQISNDKDALKKHLAITLLHRTAAEWLGRKPDWTDQVKTGDEIVDCPACTSKIKSTASVCPVCRIQIKALPSSLAALPGNADMSAVEPARQLIPPPIKPVQSQVTR
jgi:hypothetical protein